MFASQSYLFTLSVSLFLFPNILPGCDATNIFGQDKENKKRVVGYVPFWEPCPSTEMTDHYTHIAIAFASTYKRIDGEVNCNWDGNVCEFKPQAICGNQINPTNSNGVPYIEAWQNAGKKVLLSVGGMGMGGHWISDPNGCWDDCIAKGADDVMNQLLAIVNEIGFDGVDINYEYFFDTTERQDFLVDLTNGLRNALGSEKIISHAPANGASDATGGGTDYTEMVLRRVKDAIDYVKPQYFNNNNRLKDVGLEGNPSQLGNDRTTALQHYSALVEGVFENDASKVVFGFCAYDEAVCEYDSQCYRECVNGQTAAEIIRDLNAKQPCNGGAGFWVASRDHNGSWSEELSDAVSSSAETCNDLTLAPSLSPTSNPTSTPTNLSMGTCGGGNVGNGLCADQNKCCSRWGYCGTTTEAHCTSSSNEGTCGGGNRGNGICPNARITRECCSSGGDCGTSEEYCRDSSVEPSATPTSAPTHQPSVPPSPTTSPTKQPSRFPTNVPTQTPSTGPTTSPKTIPIKAPTLSPTRLPTNVPTQAPSTGPTTSPKTIPIKAPTLSPTRLPTKAPTRAPSTGPTVSPTAEPIEFPTDSPTRGPTGSPNSNYVPIGTCGGGNVGNGLCADQNKCCSRWGYCGTTAQAHCTSSSNEGTCGGENRGNGICPNARITRECCSSGGDCGTSEEHCRDPSAGFCSWGDDGTANTSTCDKEEGGVWCNESQDNCESGCSGRWCPL